MDAIDRYRQAAISHGEETEESISASRINHAYEQLTCIRRELREAGPEHARLILTLLDDVSIHVRLKAAVDALELSPDDGVRVLRAIAHGPNRFWQTTAETLLGQWETGTFKMPW